MCPSDDGFRVHVGCGHAERRRYRQGAILTRAKFDDTFSFAGSDMVRPVMLANHEVVKRMSMAEEVAFWRWVMQRAADRGIQVCVFTWNVFTFGAEGKHGITCDMGNAITKRYFRASVRERVKAYALLAGMGITAGEGMPLTTRFFLVDIDLKWYPEACLSHPRSKGFRE